VDQRLDHKRPQHLKHTRPLSLNADAVLTLAITLQHFKLTRRGNHEIAQVDRTIEILQPLPRPLLDPAIERSHEFALETACVSLFLKVRITT
jgi:hypothetical protein